MNQRSVKLIMAGLVKDHNIKDIEKIKEYLDNIFNNLYETDNIYPGVVYYEMGTNKTIIEYDGIGKFCFVNHVFEFLGEFDLEYKTAKSIVQYYINTKTNIKNIEPHLNFKIYEKQSDTK